MRDTKRSIPIERFLLDTVYSSTLPAWSDWDIAERYYVEFSFVI